LLHILQLFPSAAHLICPEVHPEEDPDDVVAAGEVVGFGDVVIPGETVLTDGEVVFGGVLGVATY
jgi:hypothetical protein